MINNANICEKYCCQEPRCQAWTLRLQQADTANCPKGKYCFLHVNGKCKRNKINPDWLFLRFVNDCYDRTKWFFISLLLQDRIAAGSKAQYQHPSVIQNIVHPG